MPHCQVPRSSRLPCVSCSLSHPSPCPSRSSLRRTNRHPMASGPEQLLLPQGKFPPAPAAVASRDRSAAATVCPASLSPAAPELRRGQPKPHDDLTSVIKLAGRHEPEPLVEPGGPAVPRYEA